MSTQEILSDLNFKSVSRILNLPNPTNTYDASNKWYVDELGASKANLDASNVDATSASSWRVALNVEDGAQVNPTILEIKTAYESNANTNAFSDADKTKLDSIDLSLYVPMTSYSSDAIKLSDPVNTIPVNLINSTELSNTIATHPSMLANNAKLTYPAVDSDKLAAIEAGATADQTGPEIVTLLEALAGTSRLSIDAIDDSGSATLRLFTSTERTKLANVEDNAQANYGVVNSIELSGSNAQLVNDLASPGNNYFYATSATGVKGWRAMSGLTFGGTTTVDSLAATAYLRVGNTIDATPGNIRYTGSAFEGNVAGSWVPLSATGVGSGNITAGADLTLNAVMVGQGTIYAAASSVLINQSAIVLGTTTGTTAGSIRYNAGVFEGRNASAWVSLGSSADAVTSSANLTTDTLVLGNAGDKTVKESTILADGGSLIFGDSTTGTTDGAIRFNTGKLQGRESGVWADLIGTSGALTGALEEVDGSIIVTAADSGKIYTYDTSGINTELSVTIPVPAAQDVGKLVFSIVVLSAFDHYFSIPAGVTMLWEGSSFTNGGPPFYSNVVGSTAVIRAVSTTQYVLIAKTGTWQSY